MLAATNPCTQLKVDTILIDEQFTILISHVHKIQVP